MECRLMWLPSSVSCRRLRQFGLSKVLRTCVKMPPYITTTTVLAEADGKRREEGGMK
jgi:hypothetical protein